MFDTDFLFEDGFDEYDSYDGARFSNIGSDTALTNKDPACMQMIDVGVEVETAIQKMILPVDSIAIQSQLTLSVNTNNEVDVPVARKWKDQKIVEEGRIDTGNDNTDRSTYTGMNALNAFVADEYPKKTEPWINWTDMELAIVIAAFAEQMVQQDGSEYTVGSIHIYILSIQRYINDLRHKEFMKDCGFRFDKVQRFVTTWLLMICLYMRSETRVWYHPS